MATNQMWAVSWLVRRLDWELTLTDLHARARLDAEQDKAPSPRAVPNVVRAGADDSERWMKSAERRTGMRRKRELRRRRVNRAAPVPSPDRGMSGAARALKIRA
jgi:hypothetical protein